MESIHDLAPEIRKRLSDLVRKLNKRGMSKPETKNISALVRGLIQTRQVMVMPVVRVMGEKIAPKKTWERLTRNMGKEGLWERLLSAHREQQRGVMMADREEICPVHGEIYSVEKEGHEQESENKKILRIADAVQELNPEVIFVLDRGGDRITLERPFLESKKRFAIRGQGQRSLRLNTDSEKLTNIGLIARRTRTTRRYVSERGKKVQFDVGIRRIYLGKQTLWLVVCPVRRKRRKDCRGI